MTAKEISESLGLSNSAVRRIISNIDPNETGIRINVFRGKFGGYELSGESFLNRISLSENQKNSLKESIIFLSKKSGFTHYSDYYDAINKFLLQNKFLDANKLLSEQVVLFRGYNDISKKEEEITDIIIQAIEDKRKLLIEYYSLSSQKSSKRIVRPYKLYTYKDFNYLAAYCEKRFEIRDFKISRIRNVEIKNEGFSEEDFSFADFVKDTFGIYKGEKYNIKLEIKYPHSELVRESLYHPEQNITDIGDNKIIFEAEMRGKEEIITWILSMGECVKVIEPDEIKKEIEIKYKKIFESLKL